jgi:hypothetical protein
MADTKISGLPASTTPLAGTEVLPIVQSGVTRQVSVANLTAGRAISATQITLTTGNLIVASGQGIDFSADPSAPGMTSELFDDYEEGTYTPTITFGNNSAGQSYAVQVGRYTKIGRVVHVQAQLIFSNKGTSTGTARVTLPFATAEAGCTASFYFISVSHAGFMQGFTVVGDTAVQLQYNPDVGGGSNLEEINFTNGSRVTMSMTYIA